MTVNGNKITEREEEFILIKMASNMMEFGREAKKMEKEYLLIILENNSKRYGIMTRISQLLKFDKKNLLDFNLLRAIQIEFLYFHY